MTSEAVEADRPAPDAAAMDASEADAGAGAPATGPVAFSTAGRGLGRLVLGNMALTLVTLGLYRFWARTRLRRLLWDCVRVDGDPLVYTGEGRELFLGFLAALVVMLPVLSAIKVATGLVPPTDPWLLMLLYGTIGVVFGMLGIVARYQVRRYLLSRTRWRGLRAGQDAPFRPFFRVHAAAWAVEVLTLGLAAPWTAARIHAFRLRHTHLGTGRFTATASTEGLWRPYLYAWGAAFIAVALFLGFAGPLWLASRDAMEAKEAGLPPPMFPSLNIWLFIGSLVMAFVAWLFSVRYRIIRFCRFVGLTRLEGVRFACPMPAMGIEGALLGHIGFMAAGAVIAVMVGLGLIAAAGPHGAFPATILFMAILYLTTECSLLLWVLPRVLTPIAEAFCIDGLEETETLLNRSAAVPRRGEGLADTLGDVGL